MPTLGGFYSNVYGIHVSKMFIYSRQGSLHFYHPVIVVLAFWLFRLSDSRIISVHTTGKNSLLKRTAFRLLEFWGLVCNFVSATCKFLVPNSHLTILCKNFISPSSDAVYSLFKYEYNYSLFLWQCSDWLQVFVWYIFWNENDLLMSYLLMSHFQYTGYCFAHIGRLPVSLKLYRCIRFLLLWQEESTAWACYPSQRSGTSGPELADAIAVAIATTS